MGFIDEKCEICGKPIGNEFYNSKIDNKLVHDDCPKPKSLVYSGDIDEATGKLKGVEIPFALEENPNETAQLARDKDRLNWRLQKFVDELLDEEREECAKIADDHDTGNNGDMSDFIADDIRARKTK